MTGKEMDFAEWMRRSCRYSIIVKIRLATMCLLMLMALAVFWPLSLILGVAFMLTLRRCWKKEIKNPPWYLREVGKGGG